MMDGSDPRMATKKAELMKLLGEARGRTAEGLRAKYAPPTAPAPEEEVPAAEPSVPEVEVEGEGGPAVSVEAEGEVTPELLAKLLELLEAAKAG